MAFCLRCCTNLFCDSGHLTGAMTYFQEEVDNVPTDPREQAFHNMIREYLIVFLILLALYGCSYLLISTYKRRKDEVSRDIDISFEPLYNLSFTDCILFR